MKKIPREVQEVIFELEKAGFEAYVVGGCVRDLLVGKKPGDWDVATNAKPEEIIWTKNTTEALNLVALGFPLEKGDSVLTTNLERHLNKDLL